MENGSPSFFVHAANPQHSPASKSAPRGHPSSLAIAINARVASRKKLIGMSAFCDPACDAIPSLASSRSNASKPAASPRSQATAPHRSAAVANVNNTPNAAGVAFAASPCMVHALATTEGSSSGYPGWLAPTNVSPGPPTGDIAFRQESGPPARNFAFKFQIENASQPPFGSASIDLAASRVKNTSTKAAAALRSQIPPPLAVNNDDRRAGPGSIFTAGRRTASQMPHAAIAASNESNTARPATPAHSNAKNTIETMPMPTPVPREISSSAPIQPNRAGTVTTRVTNIRTTDQPIKMAGAKSSSPMSITSPSCIAPRRSPNPPPGHILPWRPHLRNPWVAKNSRRLVAGAYGQLE